MKYISYLKDIFYLKDNPFTDSSSNQFPTITTKKEKDDSHFPKEKKEEDKITKTIMDRTNTQYKEMSGRFYTPNTPMYSSLFSSSTHSVL